MPLWQEEGPLWAGRQGGRPTAPSPQPHGHPGPHATGTNALASACPCVRPGGDQWPVSLGQVRPDAVRAVAVPADPLRGLLRPGHPATNGEQPPGWSQSPQRGLGAGAAPLGRVTIFRAREERGPGCTGLLVGLSSAPAIPLFPGVRLGTLSPGEQRAQHRATPGEWGAGSGGGGPAGYLGWAVRLVPTGAGPAPWGADSAWRP